MISTDVPKINEERYNALGRYVLEHKGARSLSAVAKAGGITDTKLGRWLRSDLDRMPPPDVIQAVAQALGRPVSVIQQVCLRATGQHVPVSLSDEQQTVVSAMGNLDQRWQQVVVDLVLRVTEEVIRRGE